MTAGGRHQGIRRGGAVAALTAGLLFTGAGVAAAQDEWPVQQPDSPIAVSDVDPSVWLTPDRLEYWNPFVDRPRLTSPFGTSTRIVCTSFHGVTMECWQADSEGRPHELQRLPANLPNLGGSSAPGGGVGHFVYPLF
ncbi:hypothetical protein OED52_19120 [Rhodococcus sp. Z13]|uniref:Uncharacterized protein n=1 Tax=Rhodococcus sacchari TaxID=2962047 RepID=A0ACD4DF56_9NOCA|nr:hypothetical protein [Rhodococcus sp. Z13]UYP18720.1 hypothetical protein OED52_19120 [Rhodococcus sp. Z13]